MSPPLRCAALSSCAHDDEHAEPGGGHRRDHEGDRRTRPGAADGWRRHLRDGDKERRHREGGDEERGEGGEHLDDAEGAARDDGAAGKAATDEPCAWRSAPSASRSRCRRSHSSTIPTRGAARPRVDVGARLRCRANSKAPRDALDDRRRREVRGDAGREPVLGELVVEEAEHLVAVAAAASARGTGRAAPAATSRHVATPAPSPRRPRRAGGRAAASRSSPAAASRRSSRTSSSRAARPVSGQAVGAAAAVLGERLDQPPLLEPGDRPVERPWPEPDAGHPLDVRGERVAVLVAVREAQQDQQRRVVLADPRGLALSARAHGATLLRSCVVVKAGAYGRTTRRAPGSR